MRFFRFRYVFYNITFLSEEISGRETIKLLFSFFLNVFDYKLVYLETATTKTHEHFFVTYYTMIFFRVVKLRCRPSRPFASFFFNTLNLFFNFFRSIQFCTGLNKVTKGIELCKIKIDLY